MYHAHMVAALPLADRQVLLNLTIHHKRQPATVGRVQYLESANQPADLKKCADQCLLGGVSEIYSLSGNKAFSEDRVQPAAYSCSSALLI